MERPDNVPETVAVLFWNGTPLNHIVWHSIDPDVPDQSEAVVLVTDADGYPAISATGLCEFRRVVGTLEWKDVPAAELPNLVRMQSGDQVRWTQAEGECLPVFEGTSRPEARWVLVDYWDIVAAQRRGQLGVALPTHSIGMLPIENGDVIILSGQHWRPEAAANLGALIQEYSGGKRVVVGHTRTEFDVKKLRPEHILALFAGLARCGTLDGWVEKAKGAAVAAEAAELVAQVTEGRESEMVRDVSVPTDIVLWEKCLAELLNGQFAHVGEYQEAAIALYNERGGAWENVPDLTEGVRRFSERGQADGRD